MTFEQLQATLSSRIKDVRITNRRLPGKGRILSPSYLAPIISTARTTLTYQIARRRGISLTEAALRLRDGEDVGPYLMSMPDAAAERANGEHRGDTGSSVHRRPGNAAYLARLALRLVSPNGTHQAWSKGGADLIPEAWRPIVERVRVEYANYGETTRRSQDTSIRALARAAWLAGYESPAELPTKRDIVINGLLRVGIGKQSYAEMAVNTYNRAANSLNKIGASLPIVEQRRDPRLRGLRVLPPQAFDTDADISHLRTDDLLPLIAPTIHQSLLEYSGELRGREEKPKMHTQRRTQIARAVAILWGHRDLLATARSAIGGPVPTSLSELELSDLYTLEVGKPQQSVIIPETSGASGGAAARLARRAGHVERGTVYQPLIRVLLDTHAEEVRTKGSVARRVSRNPYQPSTTGLLDSLTKVTRDVLRAVAQADDRLAHVVQPILARVHAVHREVQAHMKEANLAAIERGTAIGVEKQKALLVSVVTLPQLVCVGLPRLAQRARDARTAYEHTLDELTHLGHSSPERHEQSQRARAEWHSCLEEYIVLAVFTAHPLRLSNLAYGRIASTPEAEFRFDIEYSPVGEPLRILSVEGHFADRLRQTKNTLAALKQRGAEQVWCWWPAIIDHELLLEYLISVRAPRVIARRLLPDAVEGPATHFAYSLRGELTDPRLALFVPSHNPKTAGDPLRYNGGYAGDSLLSSIAGRGLHRVARDILGHSHIPRYEECAASEWCGLFAGHSVRLLWATYWHGLRGQIEVAPVLADGTRVSGTAIAEWATTDDARTLDAEYTAVSARMRARLLDSVDSWTHPRAYDTWMDRALRREAIDWSRERVPLPPALGQLAAPVRTQRRPVVLFRRPRRVR